MKSIFRSILLTLCILFVFAGSVNAFRISPSTQRLELSPGETFDYLVGMQPTADHEKIGTLKYSIEPAAVDFDENGNRIFLEGEDMMPTPPYSATHWITFNEFEKKSSDEEGVVFNGTIDVPDDAKPGTYYAALITRARIDRGEVGSMGAALDTRAIANIVITIPGEVNENAEILNFSLDEQKLKQGDFVFLIEIQSESDLVITPMGEITIYDEQDNKVEGIILNTKTMADGTQIFASEENAITINPSGLSVPPNTKKIIESPWNNKNIKSGNYTAKLNASYGREGTLNEELNFEIKEDITVGITPENSINSGLPVNFSGIIENRGSSNITASVEFEIINMFGQSVFSKNYPQIIISSGGEFNIADLEWAEGFALGSYTAVLTMTYGSTANTLTAKASFVVMNWWQIIIAFVLAIVILFFIYKGIKNYIKMKKKVEKLDKKK